MKRLIYIALLLFTVHCSLLTATAQSRTNRLTRPCPGSTTPATVSISVAGNITLTPCASGTVTINGVKVYRALLTQSGTSAPTATVLENTLGGTVVWTRSLAGVYIGTLSGAFPANKVVLFINSFSPSASANFAHIDIWRFNDNTVRIQSLDVDLAGNTSNPTDDLMDSTSVSILVYP